MVGRGPTRMYSGLKRRVDTRNEKQETGENSGPLANVLKLGKKRPSNLKGR